MAGFMAGLETPVEPPAARDAEAALAQSLATPSLCRFSFCSCPA